MMMTPADRLIVALDLDGLEQAVRLVKALVPAGVTHFKVGLGLFTREGPGAIEAVHRQGGQVFLDLKFHDIPSTVSRASRAVVQRGVWMANLHIQGGSAMMRQAIDAVRDEARRCRRAPPLLLGVTVLTSMAQRDLVDLGLRKPLKDQVLYLARLAQSVGLDGIVASAQEALAIRWACERWFLIVTPGIRPATDTPRPDLSLTRPWDDQQRTATPAEAVKAGADYIVVGRPILEAKDPVQVAQGIVRDMEGSVESKKEGVG
jgi:orotidine-5'-phosphate decarboxylase